MSIFHYNCIASWVIRITNTSGHNTPLGYYTDGGPMYLGQCNSLGEYCGHHTAFFVFLISLRIHVCMHVIYICVYIHT